MPIAGSCRIWVSLVCVLITRSLSIWVVWVVWLIFVVDGVGGAVWDGLVWMM